VNLPIIAILLIALLIGLFGFWKTVAALFGSIGLIVLLVVVGVGAAAASAWVLIQKGRQRLNRLKP
jgi:hypothetical protein